MLERRRQATSETHPRVSVVLPAYNEETRICEGILELEKQTYKDREILIVDDGSTDRTVSVAGKAAAEYPRVTIIPSEHAGPAQARNIGIERSSGQIIFFAECDCVYDEDYIEKAVDALDQDPGAGAVCLTGAPLITKKTLGTECLDMENKIQHRLLEEGKIKPFYAWVYTRHALQVVGGFDVKLFQAEDKDLFQRIKEAGFKVAWVPGIHWRHIRDESTSTLAKEWVKRGKTRILYVVKHRQFSDLLKSSLPLWLFCVGVVASTLSPLFGLVIVVISLALPAVASLRMIILAWKTVIRKRIFLWYPIFVLIRNFSLALGYSYGLAAILLKKIQRKPISWQTI